MGKRSATRTLVLRLVQRIHLLKCLAQSRAPPPLLASLALLHPDAKQRVKHFRSHGQSTVKRSHVAHSSRSLPTTLPGVVSDGRVSVAERRG